LPASVFEVTRSKRTSQTPSPGMARDRNSSCFVFRELHPGEAANTKSLD
jgi:hypothetical protein